MGHDWERVEDLADAKDTPSVRWACRRCGGEFLGTAAEPDGRSAWLPDRSAHGTASGGWSRWDDCGEALASRVLGS